MNLRKLRFPLLLLTASLVAHGQVLTTSQNNNLDVNVKNTSTTASQAITSSQCAQVALGGAGSVKVWITSNAATGGTVVFQISGDGVNFASATLYPDPQGSAVGVTATPTLNTVTAGNAWSGNLAGGTTFQACGSSVSGGTVNVQVTASSAPLVWPGCVLGTLGQCNVGIVSGTVTLTPSGSSGNGTSATFINLTGAITSIKGAQGNLYGFQLTNETAASAYIEFWNVASGSVTLGTTAPTYAWKCPASAQCFVTLNLPIGFATAITYAAVTSENGGTTANMTGVIEFK